MPACVSCGADAGPETWRKWCRVCYAANKRAEENERQGRIYELERELRSARAEIARLGGAGGQTRSSGFGQERNGHLAPERVRELLMLCHPDKHGGSELATRVTQWLLAQKR